MTTDRSTNRSTESSPAAKPRRDAGFWLRVALIGFTALALIALFCATPSRMLAA